MQFMSDIEAAISLQIASLPKAELHVHLEGSVRPSIARLLAKRHGVELAEEEVLRRYAYRDFPEFLDAFKWVTAFLRDPEDYALLLRDFAGQLLLQRVTYVEITLSVGVMRLRKQNVEANFAALSAAAEPFAARGLTIRWIFDAVRQFGPEAAMQVVDAASRCNSPHIVAFGMGGDEISFPARNFRAVYDAATDLGLHRLIHAGEIGGPESIREAIEQLRVERIGHGIAAFHDPALIDLLAERRIPLEICPQSNIRTGALAKQLGRHPAGIEDHPLPQLFRSGVPVVLSTDDPAMFRTTLQNEYAHAQQMGLTGAELTQIVKMSFIHAFASPDAS
jgi:adenosine deaminase